MGKFIYPRISMSPRIFIPRIPIEKYLADKNNLHKLTNSSIHLNVIGPTGRRLQLIPGSRIMAVRNPNRVDSHTDLKVESYLHSEL